MELEPRCWYKDVCLLDSSKCSSNCIRYKEMRFMIKNSGLSFDRSYPEALYAGIDRDSFKSLKSIKDNIEDLIVLGGNVYITSTITGNGKTSWAIKLLLKHFDNVWAGNGFVPRGLFVHVPTLLDSFKNFEDTTLFMRKELIKTVDLVVWDDIGSSKLSPFDISQLLILIDTRMVCNKANIFTGNIVTLEDLQQTVGSRLASRIWNNSKIVQFNGKDRRGTITDNQ